MKTLTRTLAFVAAASLALACAVAQPGTGVKAPAGPTSDQLSNLPLPGKTMKLVPGKPQAVAKGEIANDGGSIRMVIHWPQRRVATIPTDTFGFGFKVEDLQGNELYFTLQQREPSDATTQIIRLPREYGMGLPVGDLKLRAWALTYEFQALAYADGVVTIERQRATPVTLDLSDQDIPDFTLPTPPPNPCDEDPNAPGCEPSPTPPPEPPFVRFTSVPDGPLAYPNEDPSSDIFPSQFQLGAEAVLDLDGTSAQPNSWYDFESDLVDVDENGLVTVIASGSGYAVIRATYNDGEKGIGVYNDVFIALADGGVAKATID